MSIKSQKELYEECSEIFEKSYSVRSLSDESLSGFDEDQLLARELLTRLSPAVLSKLRKKFVPTTINDDDDIKSKVEAVMAAAAAAEGVAFPAQARAQAGLAIDADAFLSTIHNIFDEANVENLNIRLRAYNTKRDRFGGLQAPPESFVNYIHILETEFKSIFTSFTGNNIGLKLFLHLSTIEFTTKPYGPKYSVHAQKLFSVLDPFRTGRIWWEDLLDLLVKIGARKTRSRAEVWTAITPRNVEMKRVVHCKRETIVALVSMESEGGFCYAAVSRGGRVGLYPGTLGPRPLYTYRALGEGSQRVRNTWITDAVYMTDAKCLVLSASNRSLTFVDAGGLAHSTLYRIISLPNIPTSMAYEPSESKGDTSELVWGDDRGDLTSLTFLQPRLMLLHKAHADKTNTYYWTDLTSADFEAYARIRRWRHLVQRSVRRLALCRRLSSVILCSHDAATALLIRHRPGLLDDYAFKVVRGVSCFHICGTSRVLVTGGPDGILRLWEPARLSPLAQLAGPAHTPIKDVAIISSRELVLSFTKNCTLDIWDIYEEALLQTLKLNFPFLGVPGKRVEFGAYCIYPGPPRKKRVELPEKLMERISSKEELLVTTDDEQLGAQSAEEIETPREPEYWERNSVLKDDPDYILWDKPDFIISCCDWLCSVTFGDSEVEASASPVPTPTHAQHALLPPELASPCGCANFKDGIEVDARESEPIQEFPSGSTVTDTKLILPSISSKRRIEHLDELLQKAGLEGILDKDFVQMKGLKHDLHQKLFRMQELSEQMKAAVTLRAPHLGLRLHDVDPIPPLPDVNEAYRHVLRLFPKTSSTSSSPRAPHTPRTAHSPRSPRLQRSKRSSN